MLETNRPPSYQRRHEQAGENCREVMPGAKQSTILNEIDPRAAASDRPF
jgi:hypothetical protein